MSGSRIEIVIALFDVFSMISLGSRKPKKSFLENRVFSVPKRDREAESALTIGNPKESILPPAIRAKVGLLEGKILPTVAIPRVILPDRSPLTF
jgi:hypothetical protein